MTASQAILETPNVEFEYTPSFAELLEKLRVTLVVSTYQGGQVVVLGTRRGQLNLAFHAFEQPMGIAYGNNRLAIGTQHHIHQFAIHQLTGNRPTAPVPSMIECGDILFSAVPTIATGNIMSHELAWGSEGLWVVNTLRSCLDLVENDRLVMRWRPPFISALADEDRCHLNGLALVDGRPRYVTALGATDTVAGWRSKRATGGVLIDIATDEVLLSGLSMPHSPRLHAGQLWLLNSGHGTFGHVNRSLGGYEPIEQMPGFTRGLALADQYAFVGISKIRDSNQFGGLPIASQPGPLRCGIGVVDLRAGTTVAVFQFHTGITELFAIEAIPTHQPALTG